MPGRDCARGGPRRRNRPPRLRRGSLRPLPSAALQWSRAAFAARRRRFNNEVRLLELFLGASIILDAISAVGRGRAPHGARRLFSAAPPMLWSCSRMAACDSPWERPIHYSARPGVALRPRVVEILRAPAAKTPA
ncbi:hypothetical protein MTO96_013283 [Rhipicephalus appendiculatus]